MWEIFVIKSFVMDGFWCFLVLGTGIFGTKNHKTGFMLFLSFWYKIYSFWDIYKNLSAANK